jgi:hypothetical protein
MNTVWSIIKFCGNEVIQCLKNAVNFLVLILKKFVEYCLCAFTYSLAQRQGLQYRNATNVGYVYRVIKKSLCTWWLQYWKLHVKFKLSSTSIQTFIDMLNCVLEDRVQNSTVHILNVGIEYAEITACCAQSVFYQPLGLKHRNNFWFYFYLSFLEFVLNLNLEL